MIFILSGPPGSGKTTASRIIQRKLSNCVLVETSKPLRRGLAELLCLSHEEFTKFFDAEFKDMAHPLFNNFSPRQAAILLVEEYLKKVFGPAVMGFITIRQLSKLVWEHAIVSGVGTNEEALELVSGIPSRAKPIICVELERPGTSFKNDSRNYLDTAFLGIEAYHINNKYDLELFEAQIESMLEKWHLINRG